MSRLPHLNISLENHSTHDAFLIDVRFFTKDKPFDFSFENSTYGIERLYLMFSKNDEEIKASSIEMINPIERKRITHIISPQTPFVYSVRGEIIDYGASVMIKMHGASYLLEKGINYQLKFRSDQAENALDIKFE